jgi:hypothetical protein
MRSCPSRKPVPQLGMRKHHSRRPTNKYDRALTCPLSRRTKYWPELPVKDPWRSTGAAAGCGFLDCRSPLDGRKVRFPGAHHRIRRSGRRTSKSIDLLLCAGPSPGIRTAHFPFNAAQAASNSERLPSCSVSDTLSCLSERA